MRFEKNTKVLTRQQLYDLVWATPMIELAKQFNFSDNGLRKICRKFSIPVPKMGFWQKLRYGKPTKKISLPAYQGKETIAINILPRVKDSIDANIVIQETIVVPDNIEKFHPLVQQTRKILSKKGHERNGRSCSHRGEDILDVRVSVAQLPRAYRIIDTIIKTLEQHSAKIGIFRESEYKTFTYAQIDGEKVFFGLDELMSIVRDQTDRFGFSDHKYVPKGKLVFRIKDHLGGCQSKWTEGKTARLEDKLTPILNGLFFAGAYLKKRCKDREEEHRRWEEKRIADERQRQLLEEEKKQGQILELQAAAWQKSGLIQDFIRAASIKRGEYAPDSQFAKWVTWAKAYADSLDPLHLKKEHGL